MIIGITGQSGCGKSTVSRLFQEKNYFVIDCDKVAHNVMSNNNDMLEEIRQEFGNGVFNGNDIDRKKLGNVVFHDSVKLSALNRITHKYIVKKVMELLANNPNCVIDAPLLFESGLDKICDKKIFVYCPEEIRINRITERDGITKEYAISRTKSQKDDLYYRSRCDMVVLNDGEAEILPQLKEIFD